MLAESHPLIRRFLRFLALPYFCFVNVSCKECTATKVQVLKDSLYIFFKLKYSPDNYSLCRLWEKPHKEWSYYYGSIYDPYQRGKLRRAVLPKKYGLLYDNKEICYELCVAKRIPLPVQYGVVDDRTFKILIRDIFRIQPSKRVIVKPVDGRGGKDIFVISLIAGKIYVQGEKCKLLFKDFVLKARSVVQEYIEQHDEVSRFSSSVNTIRIITLLSKVGSVIFLGAFMRFGVSNSFVDNTSQGGVKVGIDMKTGTLKGTACDFKSRVYELHPTTGVMFEGFKIPFWNQVLQLATKVQKELPYSKLMGQDIAIGPSGPILIEINPDYDNVGLEQACGPILKDRRVQEEFKRYGLLINRFQKNLF